MAYDNTDKGALFKNDKKEKDSHPDYKGSINIGGAEFWLSAWLKTAESGRKYMSLSVQSKEQAKPAAKAKAPPPRGNQSLADMDDDIPW